MDLNTQVTYLKGIGPRRGSALEEYGIHTLRDLLFHLPRRYVDRSTITPINKLQVDQEVTVVGRVTGTRMARGKRRSYFEMVITDEQGFLKCRWFNGAHWVRKRFQKGEIVAVSGKVDFFNGFQLVHPEFDILSEEGKNPVNTGIIVPLYPSGQVLQTVGLDSRGFRRILRPIMDSLGTLLQDPLPDSLRVELGLADLAAACRRVHFPESPDQIQSGLQRIKFDELFYLQLLLALRRHHVTRGSKANRYQGTGPFLKSQYDQLPFQLTGAQKRVMEEIWTDLQSPHPMNRLLQGDVGSGKTVISLLSAAIAAGSGFQSALMAPTEILAEQHFQNAREFFAGSPIRPVLLTGSQTSAQRRDQLKALREGYYHLAVGTHALIQDKVVFQNLQLVIIDEQHRFGVLQRSNLMDKAADADVLVMTATPIPRTLAMTLYGDLAVSIIDELPAGRKPIQTRKVDVTTLPRVYGFLRDELKQGRQIFVVYPLIEESEKIDLEAATAGYEHMLREFPDYQVALLHGQMKQDEKDRIMTAFSANKIQILVSTTVIEVGIDVPNATVMVVENAERFGLAQLHQLRGRIGRGAHRGVCVLVQRKPSGDSNLRLDTLVSTRDGFKIAEEDLKLRGAGDLFGTKQHGLPPLRVANLIEDAALLQVARQQAFNLIREDPQLRRPAHLAIRDEIQREYSEYLEFAGVA